MNLPVQNNLPATSTINFNSFIYKPASLNLAPMRRWCFDMKLLLFWIIIIISGFQFIYPQQPAFSQIYKFNSSYLTIELFGQHNYLCCGTNPHNLKNNFTIACINSGGNVEWQHVYTTRANSPKVYQSVAVDGDTAFMFIVPRTENDIEYLELVRMNNGGEIKFTKNISRNYNFYSGIIKRSHDEFAAAITSHDTLSLILFNVSGNIIGEHNYKIYSPLGASASFSMINTSDGGLMISVYNSTIKLDNNYQQEWIRHEPNIIYLANADGDNFVSLYKGKLIKYDRVGNTIWQKNISEFAKSVLYIPTGYYLIPYRNPTAYYFLTKLNSEGDSLSSFPIRGSISDMKFCEDDYFIMGGQLYGDISWLTKTDINCRQKIVDFEDYRLPKRFNISSYIKLYWYMVNVQMVDIDYSTDRGQNWINIAKNITARPFNWAVPWTPSNDCLLRASESGNPIIYDISDSNYTIILYKDYSYIAANNVLMWASNFGDGSHDPIITGGGFYWPGGINNDGKSAIYEDGLCWGGKINGQIRVNGSTHQQGIKPGSILPDGSPADPLDSKYRMYKIKKGWADLPDTSIEKKIYEYDYYNWAGDIGGEYNDVNGDGTFTPNIDVPKFLGDEELFYTANDLDTTASRLMFGSDPIGLEFQTSIFAFNTTDPLANAVFKKYVIINKSGQQIDDMYLTYWADDDLGYAIDDWSAIDTNLAFSYTYNSNNDDEIYGTAPPAIAHQLLQSPIVPGGINDSAFYKSRWIKNYKNININSGGMLIKFRAPWGFPSSPVSGYYQGTIEFYNIMMGLSNDGSEIRDPITNAVTTFCVPGDPVANIGWYHGTGWPGGQPPGDSYNYLTCGPFTMAPGDTQEVVYAIFIAKGNSNLNSITILRENAAFIRDKFYKNFPDFEDEAYVIPKINFEMMQNYPNPFNSSTKIRFSVPFDDDGTPTKKNVTIKIYDILGREIKTIVNNYFAPGNYETVLNVSSIASGVYFYRLEAGSFTQTKKMVLIR